MDDDEFDLEMSPLCQELSHDGQTVQVDIYRGNGSDWHLEVVDEFGNSTVWDDQFPTDQEALNEAKATIRDEGIDSLIGAPS
jgi:hypothetical protein